MDSNHNQTKLTVPHIIAVVIFSLICSALLVGAEMYWQSNFTPIALPAITSQAQVRESSSSTTLTTSGNAEISAVNTTAAQLTHATSGDTLVTEYKLTFDDTGGTTGVDTGEDGGDEWQLYNVFLTTGTEGDVMHVQDDNDVKVTLYVRASNYANEVADAGTYTADQTLTVQWVGP